MSVMVEKKAISKKPMVATVDKKFPDKSETHEEQVIGQPVVQEPHATVSFKMGITHNMGDFNSLRIDVMLAVPCTHSEEGIEEAFEFAQTWVDRKLTSLRDEIENA